MSVDQDFAGAADETIRVPGNLMHFIRQSYDTREKMLDWMLALGVAGALTFAFRDEIRTWLGIAGEAGPNVGRADNIVPNQDIGSAFPYAGREGGRWPALYNYNMPSSRNIRYNAGPSGTRPPRNPSLQPTFDTKDT